MRGGTSKAAMFLARDLPADPAERDRLLLALYGSPDPSSRQLDGIGGGTSSTSKAAVISPSDDPRADLDYLFAQVGIDRAEVDLRGNCGNISSAVGPFAIDAGLVAATGALTQVRIRNLNTDSIIVAHVPTRDGRFDPIGDLAIPGVPGTGSPIRLDFEDPAGAVTGALLPSGAVVEDLAVRGRVVRASIVDAANPVVFVTATDLGLRGDEGAEELDGTELRALVAAVRAEGAVRARIVGSLEEADSSPAVPRVAVVTPPRDYVTRGGTAVSGGDVDVVAWMYSMGRLHAAYPFTGAVATAVGAHLEGSVVHEVARQVTGSVRIGHPGGVQELDAVVERVGGSGVGAWAVRRVSSYRTARRLMTGVLDLPPSLTR
jgi:2-methylaconitate cis-trans-isomerase PrpF